jgi:hypothetical protein
MTCSGVCLRAMIREFPPVSILGHETHTDTGLLPGNPTNGPPDASYSTKVRNRKRNTTMNDAKAMVLIYQALDPTGRRLRSSADSARPR